MSLYHIVDKDSLLVLYADKEEVGSLGEVAARYPDRIVVASQTGEPNAPAIFPGFLWHDGCFWAPQRMANQITSGNVTLDKDEFLRLFDFSELVEMYNYEDDANLSIETKRMFKAFLKYLDGATRISLQHPTVLAGLHFFESIGYLAPGRITEILSATFKQ